MSIILICLIECCSPPLLVTGALSHPNMPPPCIHWEFMHSLELSLFEWMIKINYEVWFTGVGQNHPWTIPPGQNHQVNVASLRCAMSSMTVAALQSKRGRLDSPCVAFDPHEPYKSQKILKRTTPCDKTTRLMWLRYAAPCRT